MPKRLINLSIIFIFSILFLSGCLFKGEQTLENMDVPPENVEISDNLENVGDEAKGKSTDSEGSSKASEPKTDTVNEEGKTNETVNRELYLLDSNGLVVPQSVDLPKGDTKAVAKQVLQYLVKGGPVTNLLPSGFQAVLPAGTEINSLNLNEDGTLIVDLSEEFKNYQAEDELKIIQAMTFTPTQFDTVDRIKLRIDGVDQNVMPVGGTPISNGYSRADGINIHVGSVSDITEAEMTTIYYPAEHDGNYYYVPVTVPINSEDQEMYTEIVNKLIEGPGYGLSGLLTVFQSGVEMTSKPAVEDGTITLTFNDLIFNGIESQSISDEAMSTLVLSLTEQLGIKSVQVKVEGVEQVYNENGEVVSEPVTREDIIEASGI